MKHHEMKKFKIIISGGGTGGHIFPAIAIANALKGRLNNVEILFVGAKDRMEMKKVPQSGYEIKGLWISGFQRKVTFQNFLFPFKLIYSIMRSRIIINNFKPDLVIGTGGFASGPILYMASKRKIPSLIQEQNSYPGITNRLLSKHVDTICVAYDNMDAYFPIDKLKFTGNPIRQSILSFSRYKAESTKTFNLDDSKKTVLVIGGSLGARTINESICRDLNLFKEHNLNLIWQTGVNFYEISRDFISKVNTRGINSFVFIEEMNEAYAAADIIISRSGAIAISELCCVGKPVILVPSPNVAEDHQTKNAQSLVNKNSALMVKDIDAKRKLVKELIVLCDNDEKQKELSSNIKKLEVKDSAEVIADLSIELL